jgi:hypothetical protein
MCRRIALVEARINAKKDNLVEKTETDASAALGTRSTADLSSPAAQPFEDSSTGTDSINSL